MSCGGVNRRSAPTNAKAVLPHAGNTNAKDRYMNKPPASLPEDEEMDPVGKPYPEQEPLTPDDTKPADGDDPPDPTFSPHSEPDIAPD